MYVWEPPGKSIAVRLSLDVVDRMQQEVMRGFGAVPKRGAEVGGVLLGRTACGEKAVVTIDDFEIVPIEYKRSPSYLLSEADAQAFDAAVKRARENPNPLLHPVGYFRSHTREGTGLGPEDTEIFQKHFPEPEAVALIVKPYATKVGMAGFYFKEDAKFQSGPPLLEFPFRRRELDPEGAPPPVRGARPADRTSLPAASGERQAHRPLGFDMPPSSKAVAARSVEILPAEPSRVPETETPADTLPLQTKRKTGGSWVWIPVSFIFLLLGLLLGFQAALSTRPQLKTGSNDPYSLTVAVSKSGDNVQVKWDRQALAIRTAQKGLLTIEDGPYSKPVPLNAFDLQSGSVVYPPQSEHVRFRLEVMVNAKDTVTETVDWHR